MKKKIVLAHPLQQHSYRTAEGLENANLLDKYITTVYYDEHKCVYNMLERILGSNNVKRMHGRKNKIVEKYLITYNEILGLLYLLLIRIDKRKILEPKLYSILINKFGKKVYQYLVKHNQECVIMYDTTGYKCFRLLDKNNKKVTKILDMSSAAAPYVRKILMTELNYKNTKYKESLRTTLKSYSDRKCKKSQKEIDMTDYFLAPSSFVKKSLLECGVKEEQILLVPYGVDLDMFKSKKYNKIDNKINFLYVGRLEYAKGIYYLIKAFEELKDLKIKLNIVGSISSKDKELLQDIQNIDNIIYHGSKRKSEMNDIYTSSDVYIMPSLFEGLSLTLFEAMASGLPVIASENSGAKGIVKNGKQGFVIDSASKEQIKEKIIWFCNNKEKIPQMGKEARILAEKYKWENYNLNLKEEIKKIK